MDHRGQFTFYRSFWDAVRGLPKKDKLPILEAVISYALDGTSPTGLTQSQLAFFLLCKPTLDASRRKAANGKQGGSKRKQTVSKLEANSKQTGSEYEKENEIEVELEKELEIENECLLHNFDDGDVPRTREPASEASVEDLALIGIAPGDYLFSVPVRVVKQVLAITGGLFADYCKCKYTPLDCRKVFEYITRMQPDGIRVLRDPVDLLRYAFEQSVMSRCPGNWRYIDAVMATMQDRGITTAAEAQAYDDSRNCGEV